MLAGGVALEALGLGIVLGFRLAASILLIVGGVLCALQAWSGWKRAELSLRQASPLPPSLLTLPLVGLIAVVATLVMLGILLK